MFRDIQQLTSIVISLVTIWAVYRRTRKYSERRRDWLAVIAISAFTVAFYLAVFFDQHYDFMIASDVSSVLRGVVQLLLLAFVFYFPRRVNL